MNDRNRQNWIQFISCQLALARLQILWFGAGRITGMLASISMSAVVWWGYSCRCSMWSCHLQVQIDHMLCIWFTVKDWSKHLQQSIYIRLCGDTHVTNSWSIPRLAPVIPAPKRVVPAVWILSYRSGGCKISLHIMIWFGKPGLHLQELLKICDLHGCNFIACKFASLDWVSRWSWKHGLIFIEACTQKQLAMPVSTVKIDNATDTWICGLALQAWGDEDDEGEGWRGGGEEGGWGGGEGEDDGVSLCVCNSKKLIVLKWTKFSTQRLSQL